MKLKKIASLMLAGVMAVSMLAGCSGNEGGANSGNDEGTNSTPATTASDVFESYLSDKANIKIEMKNDSDLTADLNTAMENVTSSTIKLFDQFNKDVVNFDGNWAGFVAEDLNIVASRMEAVGQRAAFQALIPEFNEADTETVTMLYAVDANVTERAAVEQVAELLDDAICQLRIDDDNSKEFAGGVDATTLHYSYTGSVSVASKTLVDNSTVGIRIVAVQITRTANA